MVKLLALDPGKTTGWAQLIVQDDKNLQLGQFGTTTDMTLKEILPLILEADEVIYEGFWLRPDKAKAGHFDWAEPPAVEVIGALKAILNLHEKKAAVKQQPSQRVMGYGFAGMQYKKGAKGKHWQDALAHAAFYAVRVLHAKPVGVAKSSVT